MWILVSCRWKPESSFLSSLFFYILWVKVDHFYEKKWTFEVEAWSLKFEVRFEIEVQSLKLMGWKFKVDI